jgi:hypothetical protein
MPKRTLLEAIASDEPDLWLKLADGGERLPAHRAMVRMASGVAKGLPPGSDEWDLSGLVIEGHPVVRSVVTAWLAAAYPELEGVEEAGEAPPLVDVLAFADAVGSARHVLRACCSRWPCRELTVQVGDDETLALQLDGRFYYHLSDRQALMCGTVVAPNLVRANTTREQWESVREQAAAALERLLFLALKLDLPDLTQQLRGAIVSNSLGGICLLSRNPALFSERVRGAVPRRLLEDWWVTHTQSQPCVIGTGPGALLEPVDEGDVSPVKFEATLSSDFGGQPAGTAVEVEVDLLGGRASMAKASGGTAHIFPVFLTFGNAPTST